MDHDELRDEIRTAGNLDELCGALNAADKAGVADDENGYFGVACHELPDFGGGEVGDEDVCGDASGRRIACDRSRAAGRRFFVL